MQILELVLYGYNHKVRHLPFKLGQVNIITGRSKSGKSAVGDIIDYCLGGNSCNIADGVVRENVAWYGLLLQFEKERVFVARKNPDKGQQTTTTCYIEVGASLEVPEQCNFSPNTNVSEHYKKFKQWNGDCFTMDDFIYITEKNNRADALANIGMDELR